MARGDRKHPENVPGRWFVDTSCIDCDASRQCAPTIFGIRGGQSVVVKQPETPEEIAAATRAMLVCPTASIGVEGQKPPLQGVFPWELDSGVYLCGYNSTASYGASSYFVARELGGLLVDAPRWIPSLAKRFEELGGIAHVLLTHKDDVGHAEAWAEHFGARVWIHEEDRSAAPFAKDWLRGRDATVLREDVIAIPVPGHTRGSVMYLVDDRFLFTGDSLYWSRALGDLCAFKRQCWYSWTEQIASLERLHAFDFEWVLPGHGDRWNAPASFLHESLARLVTRMKQGDPRLEQTLW